MKIANGCFMGIGLLCTATLMNRGVIGEEGGPKAEPAHANNIVEVLRADGHFKIFIAALTDTELDKTLSGNDSYTVFAPTDEAFEKVPRLGELMGDREFLKRILFHHLIAQKIFNSGALRRERLLMPVQGDALKVESDETELKINEAKVVNPNLKATNGIVHGINRVLMKNNDSWLREAGGTIEKGLKTEAEKIKKAFTHDKEEEPMK